MAMPKKTKQTNQTDDNLIVDDEEDEEIDVKAEELDPEVLDALENKKKKKTSGATNTNIDYIPELERDTDTDVEF